MGEYRFTKLSGSGFTRSPSNLTLSLLGPIGKRLIHFQHGTASGAQVGLSLDANTLARAKIVGRYGRSQ
jgi:hypothetical protein